MVDTIFDILGNVVVFLIGLFIGCAYSLYRKCLKKVNHVELQIENSLQTTQDSLHEINLKLETINLKLDLNFPHFHPKKEEEKPKKRRPGRPPKSIEMKNPQQ